MLYDTDQEQFTRGRHEGEDLCTVAEKDPQYLIFLVEVWNREQATVNIVNEFIDCNPELFAELID